MKKTIITILVLSILSACTKKEGEVRYLTGQLLTKCGGQPVAHQYIDFYQSSGSYQGGVIIGSDTTDANGYFKIAFVNKYTGDPYSYLRTAPIGGAEVMLDVPGTKSIDGLKVYQNSTCTLSLKLIAQKQYTNMDTLYVNAFRGYFTNKAIVGPFTSGYIATGVEYNLLAPTYIGDITGVSYKIGKLSTWTTVNQTVFSCGNYESVITIQ